MSTNKTANYNLHSWVPGDDFLRAEFNENFALIDGALGEMPRNKKLRVVTGSYTGDSSGSRTIALPFTPKAVMLTCKGISDSYCINAIYLPGVPSGYGEIVEGGFTVSNYLNIPPESTAGILSGQHLNPYRYVALNWEE